MHLITYNLITFVVLLTFINRTIMSNGTITETVLPLDRSEFDLIKEIIADAEVDADKFFGKNNKAAGVRLRKKMLEVNRLTLRVRKTVIAINKKDITSNTGGGFTSGM